MDLDLLLDTSFMVFVYYAVTTLILNHCIQKIIIFINWNSKVFVKRINENPIIF